MACWTVGHFASKTRSLGTCKVVYWMVGHFASKTRSRGTCTQTTIFVMSEGWAVMKVLASSLCCLFCSAWASCWTRSATCSAKWTPGWLKTTNRMQASLPTGTPLSLWALCAFPSTSSSVCPLAQKRKWRHTTRQPPANIVV